ncbi:hypothetical protein AB0Y20_01140 [Heyndrickxia oleronia]|uniref:hypothetical protein n=1 Tax=Heyndrickxia oleronia TaxID=38875 RepID=UPI003F28651F
MKQDESFVNLILYATKPKYMVKPLKLLLKTPFYTNKIVIQFSDEDKIDPEMFTSPLEKDLLNVKVVENPDKDNRRFSKEIIELIKQYKNNGYSALEVIRIFSSQLEKYKISMDQLPKLVYKIWDVI